MLNKTVPVKNIARLSQASTALLSRAPSAPGMGLVDGETGYGKSTAIAWLHTRLPQSVYVRALACWTPSAMLGAISRELRLQAGGSCAQMVERIVDTLALGRQVVFIDEADYLVTSTRMTETLRDLHDMAIVPVVLIGMAGIEQRLSHRKQLTGRIAQHVTFQPLDLEDATLMARELCEVEIKPDLMSRVHADCHGSARLIVVSLAKIEQMAKAKNLSSVNVEQWGKRQLFTGDAPAGNVTPMRAVA